MKKFIKIFAIFIALFLAVIIIVPYIFKDDLIKLVNEEANKSLKGELVIGDLDVSLIKNFPDLSLSLQELSYTGIAPFAGEKLFDISEIVLRIDIMKAIAGNGFEVKSIKVVNPDINVKILKDGSANYDIMKEVAEEQNDETEETTATDEAFSFQLNHLGIENLNLAYADAESNMHFSVNGMNHVLSGNFTNDITDVKTETTFDKMNFAYGGVKYLRDVKGASDFDVVYNSAENSIAFGDNFVELNRVRLAFEGDVKMLENGYDLNIKYGNEETNFKALMSLIPAVYKTDFDDIKSSGTFSIAGNANGKYIDGSDDYPAFNTELIVNNGVFSYEGYSASLKEVNVDLDVNHPGGDLDAMKIDLEKLSANVAGNPFSANLKISNPMSDPNVSGLAKGKIDLASINQIMPLEDELSGLVLVDINFSGRVSDFENANMDKAKAGGTLALSNLKWLSQEYNIPLSIDSLFAELSPNRVNMPVFNSKVGASDFAVTGNLTNAFAYAFSDEEIRGNLNINSKKIDLNEFASWASAEETDSAVVVENSTTTEIEVIRIPENISFKANMKIKELIYEENTFDVVNGKLSVEKGVANLTDLSLGLKGGRIVLSGSYNSVPQKPLSNLNFRIKALPFKEAYSSLGFINKYMPFAKDILGDLNTNLNVKTALNADMTPDYKTLTAKGIIKTAGLSYSSKALKEANKFFVNDDISKVKFTDANLSFEVANGMATIKPIKVKLGGQEFTLKGSHSIEQEIDYSLKGKIPVGGIELPKELAILGIDASAIDLELKVGGTVTKPTITPVFGDIELDNIVKVIVEEIKDSVITVVKKNVKEEADKILAQAQAQADALLAEARKQTATLKVEADKQAEVLKKEAEKVLADLKREAGSNPIKQIAAEVAGETALKEANKQIDALNKTAKQEADKILLEAKKQADEIMRKAQAEVQKLEE